MKRFIEPLDYATEICSALPKGVLLTTAAQGRVNTMTIGWGTLGVDWSRPVFTAYVRTGRFTHEMLAANPEFTVNVPLGEFDRSILGAAGTVSGRDEDKVARLGLTLVDPEVVSVPAIAELPLTLECRVLYTQDQQVELLPPDIRERMYPAGVPSTACGANADAHTVYYGEIVSAYIVE